MFFKKKITFSVGFSGGADNSVILEKSQLLASKTKKVKRIITDNTKNIRASFKKPSFRNFKRLKSKNTSNKISKIVFLKATACAKLKKAINVSLKTKSEKTAVRLKKIAADLGGAFFISRRAKRQSSKEKSKYIKNAIKKLEAKLPKSTTFADCPKQNIALRDTKCGLKLTFSLIYFIPLKVYFLVCNTEFGQGIKAVIG